MSELKDLQKIARATLKEVEKNGWTIQVHTNCLAILRRLPKVPATPPIKGKE